MDRYWLLTWTCCGTWLSGDRRGLVSRIEDEDGNWVTHGIPGTPYDADMPEREIHARSLMTGTPVSLDLIAAQALIAQYRETARIRHWELEAVSVMVNHTHLMVGVPGDPDPQSLQETFKSWATRAVKKLRPVPANDTYWTKRGSKRTLPDETARRNAVVYTACKQPDP